MSRLVLCVLFLLIPMSVWGQTVVRNPRSVTFTCPDHAQDDNHEIDIVRASDGVVVQTITGGDPPADAEGMVTIALNVQPVAFGTYTVRVRAVAAGIKSDASDSSDVWERAPGKPTGLIVK
jgi:hypothetical protein